MVINIEQSDQESVSYNKELNFIQRAYVHSTTTNIHSATVKPYLYLNSSILGLINV